ncbi:MAG TPA: LLM class F420-dependent oxidoreductase [Kineosporiaceae bacterium]|nr:LLM class F420-dependent oxidoreductase [Kineosporiaceae bacterium]
MELNIFTEPQQGASYDTLLAVARTAEASGFSGFFRSDHYLAMGGGDGLPGPSDAWVCLAGLARETARIRLGTLVSPATFRLPGVLAVQVAQVDQMSGGRVTLGLGAGWFEAEHAAYGIPFPGVSERFDRLEEQLAIVTGLLGTPLGATFSFRGDRYTLTDSPALPKPVQRPVPLIVGGGGKRRTPALAARFATEFNFGFCPPEAVGPVFRRVRDAATAIGRDPAQLIFSTPLTTVVGKDDAQLRQRVAAFGGNLDELRRSGLAGTPAEVVDRIGRYAEQGVQKLYLQVFDLSDLDHLEFIAAEVAPQLG